MHMIDVDAHVEESVATWQTLDPVFYPRRPLAVTFPADTSFGPWNAGWVIDRVVCQYSATPTTMELARRKPYAIASQELTDVAARLRDLDAAGIALQVINPSLWLGCLTEDVAFEAALAAAYNDFLAARCAESGGRLRYTAVLPFRDPDRAVAELRRIVPRGSVAGVFVRPIEWDRTLDDSLFAPIWAEVERQALVVSIHVGSGSPTIHRVFYPLFTDRGRFHFDLLAPVALASLLEGGLAERFPGLRWLFCEFGAGWVTARLGSLYSSAGAEAIELFRSGTIAMTCEPHEDLRHVLDRLGDRCLVVGSDMPHADAAQHRSPEADFRSAGLDDTTLQRILVDNPLRLFRIPAPAATLAG